MFCTHELGCCTEHLYLLHFGVQVLYNLIMDDLLCNFTSTHDPYIHNKGYHSSPPRIRCIHGSSSFLRSILFSTDRSGLGLALWSTDLTTNGKKYRTPIGNINGDFV